MNKKSYLSIIFAFFSASTLVLWGTRANINQASLGIESQPSQKISSTTRPNIIFLLTDDLDKDSYVYMPQLKSKIIDQGIYFDRYFVNTPLCCPSRATTLRGQYSHNTEIVTTSSFIDFYNKGREASTIATWLNEGGYKTVLIGKYLNGYKEGPFGTYVPPGWTEWYAQVSGDSTDYVLNENGSLVTYHGAKENYITDVYTRKATDFIRRSAESSSPFFLYLSTHAPHKPATPAPRHKKLFLDKIAPRTPAYNEADVTDKPRFIQSLPLLDSATQLEGDKLYQSRLQSLQAVDDGINKIYQTLKQNRLLWNTYFFFSSDNGYHLGQHRLPEGKATGYEEDIRVPLIVRGPKIPHGQTRSHLTGNVDLAPTFADLAKVPIPEFVDGRSLLPLLRGSPPALNKWRQAYLLERIEHLPASVGQPLNPSLAIDNPPDRDEKLIGVQSGTGREPSFFGLRTLHYSYIEYDSREKELYNLDLDPDQLDNTASTQKNLAKRLSNLLSTLKSCTGTNCKILESQPMPR